MLLVKSELYLSKDWLDTDGVGAADATRETFGQLDLLFDLAAESSAICDLLVQDRQVNRDECD